MNSEREHRPYNRGERSRDFVVGLVKMFGPGIALQLLGIGAASGPLVLIPAAALVVYGFVAGAQDTAGAVINKEKRISRREVRRRNRPAA